MSDVRVIQFLVSELRLPDAERAKLGVEWWPSYGHAVEHPGGVFLFDNGAGFGNAEIDATFSPRVRPVDDALEAAGISLADVTGAANCHLHFDHCGQNAQLRGLPIFVQRTEWAMVHEPDYTVPEWVDVPGLSYELLDGEIEVAPGIGLVPTPGHTAGHQSLVLDVPGGVIVLAGQAVQSRAEWEGAEGPEASGRSSASDSDAYGRSVDRPAIVRPRPGAFRPRPVGLGTLKSVAERDPETSGSNEKMSAWMHRGSTQDCPKGRRWLTWSMRVCRSSGPWPPRSLQPSAHRDRVNWNRMCFLARSCRRSVMEM